MLSAYSRAAAAAAHEGEDARRHVAAELRAAEVEVEGMVDNASPEQRIELHEARNGLLRLLNAAIAGGASSPTPLKVGTGPTVTTAPATEEPAPTETLAPPTAPPTLIPPPVETPLPPTSAPTRRPPDPATPTVAAATPTMTVWAVVNPPSPTSTMDAWPPGLLTPEPSTTPEPAPGNG
jgi:hypothetical protein